MRWGDMDAYQHVNNVAYFSYLEEARVDMLFVLGDSEGMAALGRGVVVAHHDIDYLAPLVYSPFGVAIDLWVSRVGGSSFTVAYDVHDDTRSYARASTVLVPYDMSLGRPRRLAEEELTFLARFTDDSENAG